MRMLGVAVANGFGSEARVFATLLAQRGRRYEVRVLHQARRDEAAVPDAAFRRFALASGAEVIPADFGWREPRAKPRSFLQRALLLARLAEVLPFLLVEAHRYRADLVYSSQQRWDCGVASLLARLLRLPQVIHLHYTVGPWLAAQPLRQLRRASAVICVSDFIREQAITHGVSPARAMTLHNAVAHQPEAPGELDDLRRELGVGREDEIVLNAARLAPGKGHADILRAFVRTAAARPRALLLIAGEGELGAELHDLAGALGLEDRVRFLGLRSDVPRLLALSRAFIHPSLQEPCPLALLEAAAQGVPTVAYADGGTPELVEDGVSGLLAPPGHVEMLGDSLLRLLEEPALAGRLGRAARERVASRFNPAIQGRAFAEMLAAVSGP